MRSAIAVTIAPAALAAAAIALLLALRLAGAGFEGDPLAVVREAGPGDRLWEVAGRRAPVIGVALLAWLAAFVVSMVASRERAGRAAARLLALSLVYAPLLCLAGAALEPSVAAERLLLMLGAAALAALTLAALGGYRALAFACATTVLAVAVDLIAGSPLTRLSLAGPNPAGGHRFYGVGNELAAILAPLVLVGTGAAMSGLTTPWGGRSRMRGAAAFLVAAGALSFVFAYGRFGADVGSAIMLPLGAAVAAAVLLGRPRLALLALLLPLPAVALLAAADLLTGADAHLTGTVLQAESNGDVLDVLADRLRQAGSSFGRPLLLAGLPLTLAGALAAWLRRDRLAAWLRGREPVRAGLLGALAAIVVGTVTNDSGALLLELGAIYLGAFCAFAWAEQGGGRDAARPARGENRRPAIDYA
ncbi:MAG: hypothetical protein WD404_06845 [Solirubrobacterales bacterium]